MPAIKATLDELGFEPTTIRGSDYGYERTLGELTTTIYTRGPLTNKILLLTMGVHGPEGIASRVAMANILNTKDLSEALDEWTFVVVPDCCPDSLPGNMIRTRNIPVYGPDGEPIPGTVIDPNLACTPPDHENWDKVNANSERLKPLWDDLLQTVTGEKLKDRAEAANRLRDAVRQMLPEEYREGSKWQLFLLSQMLVPGQSFYPHGLFYWGNADKNKRLMEFNFLRDVLVPSLAEMLEGAKEVRAIDIHTGLPSMYVLPGTPELQRRSYTLLYKEPEGDTLPWMTDTQLIGEDGQLLEACEGIKWITRRLERVNIMPDKDGGSMLSALSEQLLNMSFAAGLEFRQDPKAFPWYPYPPSIDASVMRRREEMGWKTEVEAMIMAANATAKNNPSGKLAAALRSERYFAFGLSEHDLTCSPLEQPANFVPNLHLHQFEYMIECTIDHLTREGTVTLTGGEE